MNLWNKTIAGVALDEAESEISREEVLNTMKKAVKEREKRYEKLRKDYVKELNARLISLAAAAGDDFPDDYISTGHIPLKSASMFYTHMPWLNKECLNQVFEYYTARGFKVEWRKNEEEEWLRIFLPSLDEEEKK